MSDQEPLTSKYTCSFESCAKEFKSKYNLTRHIESYHNGLRPFECDLCFKRFSSKQNMNEHKRIEHSYNFEIRQNLDIPSTVGIVEIRIPELTKLVKSCTSIDLRPYSKVERIYLQGDDWERVLIPSISRRKKQGRLPNIFLS